MQKLRTRKNKKAFSEKIDESSLKAIDVFVEAETKESLSEMNKSNVKNERIPALCFGCLSNDKLSNMSQTYYYQGKPEVYEEMLAYCFSIQINDDGDKCLYGQHLMCPACVTQLRAAADFRRQLEVARDNFRAIMVEGDGSQAAFNDDRANDSPIDFEPQEDKANADFDMQLNNPTWSPFRDSEQSDGDFPDPPKVKQKTKAKRKAKVPIFSINYKLNDPVWSTFEDDSSTDSDFPFKPTKEKKEEKADKVKKKESKEEKEKKKPQKRTIKKPYKLNKTDTVCSHCGKDCGTNKTLVMHMNVHYPLHVCEQCGRGYATWPQLRGHFKLQHSGHAQVCHHCDKAFKNHNYLRAHLRSHTGDNKVFRCPHCPERFTNYEHRVQHMVGVHGAAQRSFPCKGCDRNFPSATARNNHASLAHTTRERRHACQACGKAFFTKSDRTRHEKTHTRTRDGH